MNAPAVPAPARLVSLDAYRGFIMLAMVSAGLGTAELRKDPAWSHLKPITQQLEHLDWEGVTFWDLIQPSFMFMVGVSMPFAFARRIERGESWLRQFGHVVKRCTLLCFIGIVMDSFGRNSVEIQFIRVLQQIAIGYFLAFFFLHLGWKGQMLGVVLLLGVHTAAFWFDGGSHAWDFTNRADNFGYKLDISIHQFFMNLGLLDVWNPSRGHYAAFNAVSSGATILMGVLVGELLKSPLSSTMKAGWLLVAGGALLGGGMLLADWMLPVKRIWTASFALEAAGWTCWMMLFFYAVIDVIGFRAWAFPFVVVGMNSIFIYFCAGTMKGTIQNLLKPFTYQALRDLGPWQPVVNACLVMAVLWVLCWFLYRQRVFFKV